jgi:DNA-binding XRE family transcriptional regulator
MRTKTSTRKKIAAAKPRVKETTNVRAGTAIVAKAISGLQGQGLLRLGDKSKLELRDRLAMTRPMFGRVVNVSERTIADAEAGKDAAKKLMRTYNEVYRLCDALSEVVDREALGLWFQTPNDAFDGLKPIEVIERGEIDRLWNMVFQLQTGMPG